MFLWNSDNNNLVEGVNGLVNEMAVLTTQDTATHIDSDDEVRLNMFNLENMKSMAIF